MKLLIISKDSEESKNITEFLKSTHTITSVLVGDAERILHKNDFKVIIICLPPGFMESVDLLKNIRSMVMTPIICIGINSDKNDIIKILDSGADDFLVKPYSLPELGARVNSLSRRTGAPISTDNKIAYQDYQLDMKYKRLISGEQTIKLTRTEFRLLAFLLRHRQSLVSKEEIIQHAFRRPKKAKHIINNYLYNLRKKLDNGFEIKTIPSLGFILK